MTLANSREVAALVKSQLPEMRLLYQNGVEFVYVPRLDDLYRFLKSHGYELQWEVAKGCNYFYAIKVVKKKILKKFA